MFPVGQEFKAKCSLLDGIQIHAYTHTHTYIHAYTQMRVANGEPSF